jgi:hypothetical protein
MSEVKPDLSHPNPEKQEAIVTPEAIRDRVLSFFEGVDFSKPGTDFKDGFERVVLMDDRPDSQINTSKAFFQGYEIATIEKGNGIGGGSENNINYSLHGQDGEKEIDLVAWFMEGEEPSFNAGSGDQNGTEEFFSQKPTVGMSPERVSEIATLLGIINKST